jgi:hypothetical protein
MYLDLWKVLDLSETTPTDLFGSLDDLPLPEARIPEARPSVEELIASGNGAPRAGACSGFPDRSMPHPSCGTPAKSSSGSRRHRRSPRLTRSCSRRRRSTRSGTRSSLLEDSPQPRRRSATSRAHRPRLWRKGSLYRLVSEARHVQDALGVDIRIVWDRSGLGCCEQRSLDVGRCRTWMCRDVEGSPTGDEW